MSATGPVQRLFDLCTRTPWLPRVLLAIAAVCGLVHTATFLIVDVDRFVENTIGPLGAMGAMMVALSCPTILRARRYQPSREGMIGFSTQGRNLPSASTWLKAVTLLAVVYGVTIFMRQFAFYGEGAAEPIPGGFGWMRDGQIVKRITEDEYLAFQLDGVRIFSAWIGFFSLGLCWIARATENTAIAPGVNRDRT